MYLSWLHQWVRKSFSAPRRPLRRRRFERPSLMPLEDRLLLSIALNLEVPPSSSYGVNNSLVIQYTNTGSTNAPAPLVFLSADKANLWLPNDPAVSGSSIQLLATNPNPNGPAGTLAPGTSGSIVVDFTSTDSTANDPIHFSIGQLTPGQTIDWSSIQSEMRPSFINANAWNAVFANFIANVGSSTDSYQAALDADATYLGQLGEPTNDISQLIAFEINRANNQFGTMPQGGAVDLSVPTPGIGLSFARSFQPTISGRNQAGLIGLGWMSNWDISASTDSQGNVTISESGGLRSFAKQSDGSYQPTLSDTGVLKAISGGGYQLTEIDGSITAFSGNGKLNYVQDPNGNRVTAGYNSGGQMLSLTESNGTKLTLTYNSQGFVSKITDPSGETVSYTYDTAGHLLSATTPQGTTKYSYITGTGMGADNALQSVLNPDGTQLNYTYNSEGWLSSAFYGTAANPIKSMTIGYLSPGGVTYTDANGNKSTILYTDLGQAGVITDPLGNTTRLGYNPSGDLTGAVLPGGATYSYTYDLSGNLLSETDGLGKTAIFTHDAKGNLISATDAKGNTTGYSYDKSNDLLSVTYANGAKQSYTYNPLGEATQLINARGQVVGYSYNTQGQLTKVSFADGTFYSYSYDTHGSLTGATDAQGHVTKFTYGGDPNNPNNPDLLTKVQYPDGTYLKFSYYAGGQRKQSVDQTGFTINYTYDAAGNLTKLSDGNGKLIVQYTYDAAGNLIQQDDGNGTRTVSTYNAASNVTSITHLAPDHITVNSFDKYTYDNLGRVHSDANQDGQWVYTYDADGQLIRAVFTPNSSNPDGLTAQNIQYAYDATGNRISQTINGVTTTYTVNNVNEYTSSTTNGTATNYQYDTDGNLIAQTTSGSTTNYSFNALSQLTGVNGHNLKASYFYDPLGNRVSQTINGATTNFQVDPIDLGNVVASFGGTSVYNNSSGLLAHYTYGMGLISQVAASGTAGYYDFDLASNTIGITNTAGSYVNKYSYLPFGQTTTLKTNLTNPFTFSGQLGVMNDGSGMADMRYREYDAATGRFISQDPLGIQGGDLNLYRYGQNQPITHQDPLGLYYLTKTNEGHPWFIYSPKERLPNGNLGSSLLGKGFDAGTNSNITVFRSGIAGFKQNKIDPGEKAHEQKHVNDNYDYGLPNTSNPLYNDLEFEREARAYWAGYKAAKSKRVKNAQYQGYQRAIAHDPTLLGLAGVFYTIGIQATTDNNKPSTSTNAFTEGAATTFEVWTGSVGKPVTSADVQFNHTQNSNYDVSATSVSIQAGQGQYEYTVYATVTFPEEGEYGVTVTVNGDNVVENPGREAVIVYDAPVLVTPVSFSVPADGQYNGPVATITDLGPANDFEVGQPTGTYPVTVRQDSGNTYTAYATVNGSDFVGDPSPAILVGIWDSDEYGPNPQGGGNFWVPFTVTAPGQPQYATAVFGQILQNNSAKSADPPLAIINTTDPSITSASQVSVSVGNPSNRNAPIPLVTGITLTHLPGGITQIEIDGVVSAVQPGAGPVAAAPLKITLGNEPPVTAQVVVNQTLSAYVVNPANVVAIVGKPVQNVQVATVAGPANGSYSALINWGDGDTSTGVITALGGGEFAVSGSKPHPYAATGTDTITVTVNGPGSIPAPATQTTATVVTAAVSPPPAPPPSPPAPSAPPSSPSPPSPPPVQAAAPNVPALLAFLNGLLGEIETVSANGTIITDILFGIPLVVETYDYSGNLVSATLFGIPLPTFLLDL